MIFGVAPALHLSRTSHREAMGTRGGGPGRRESRVRGALVVGQLAMATVLLVGAGLLARSFVRLAAVDRGYDPSGVLVVAAPVSRRTTRLARKIESIEAHPGASPGDAAA